MNPNPGDGGGTGGQGNPNPPPPTPPPTNPGGPQVPPNPSPNPTPAPTPTPTEQPTLGPQPGQQGQPRILNVAEDYLNNLLSAQTRLAEIERQAEAERQRIAAERDQLVAESTQHRQAFEQSIGERDQRINGLTEQLNALRASVRNERVGRTIADAMAGVQFARDEQGNDTHARQQAAQLLQARVAVAERDGDFVVTSPTGTPAGEYLRSLLQSSEFAHFLAPSSRGGSGAINAGLNPAGGGNPQNGGNGLSPNPAAPLGGHRNVGEYLMAQVRGGHAPSPVGGLAAVRRN